MKLREPRYFVSRRRAGRLSGVQLFEKRGKCRIRRGGCGANLLKDPCRRLARRDAFAHGPIEIADLGIDAGDQRLDRQHRLLVGDDGPKLFDRLPQDADALGGRDHSIKALDLILRVADFSGGFDHVGCPALNVHRQLERRHADFDQAVEDALDLVEAHQRKKGRADGQRRRSDRKRSGACRRCCDARLRLLRDAGKAASADPSIGRVDGVSVEAVSDAGMSRG